MNTPKIFTLLSGLLFLSACGSQVAHDGSNLVSGAATTINNGVQTGSSGNVGNIQLAPEFVAKINGANGAVPTAAYPLDTSRTLKVKVTALSAPNLTYNNFNNWVFPYGCLRLQVSANGTTQTTQILRVDGASQGATSACKDAPTSQVLDFTNAMTGAGPFQVIIHNAEYDNCRYTWPLNYGCSMSAIFTTHIIAASIAMQVDGTWLNP